MPRARTNSVTELFLTADGGTVKRQTTHTCTLAHSIKCAHVCSEHVSKEQLQHFVMTFSSDFTNVHGSSKVSVIRAPSGSHATNQIMHDWVDNIFSRNRAGFLAPLSTVCPDSDPSEFQP